jgi:hypothetical protein
MASAITLLMCASEAARADTRPPDPSAAQRFTLFSPGGPPAADWRTFQPNGVPRSLFVSPATAAGSAPPAAVPPAAAASLTPGQQCLVAIRTAERASGIPDHLLAAIARVESGRPDAAGMVSPWPWSINAEGVDHVFESKPAAIAGVLALQAHGVRSIDVGCMQVNLLHHPGAFATLDQAFDPIANANYAARFLTELFAQSGSWDRATAWYHSMTPELGGPYQRKVAAAVPQERMRGDPPVTSAWASAATGGAAQGDGAGAIMLGNRAEAAKLLPMASGAVGRGLDRYRQTPIPIASRTAIRGPG